MNKCMQAQQQLKQQRVRLNGLVTTLVQEFGYRDVRERWPRQPQLVVSPNNDTVVGSRSYHEALVGLESELARCREAKKAPVG